MPESVCLSELCPRLPGIRRLRRRAAPKSDGAGGSKLSLGTDGSIDFAHVAPSSLHPSNFKSGEASTDLWSPL
jgi:hypothetical protein